jgi:hypothetical protein
MPKSKVGKGLTRLINNGEKVIDAIKGLIEEIKRIQKDQAENDK